MASAMPVRITEVWNKNLFREMSRIDDELNTHNTIALDTEFPGFLKRTKRDAFQSQRYAHLKYNVDRMKLVQLGLTLFDDQGNVGGTWQINFSNFDMDKDEHGPSSIDFLLNSGIDLQKNTREGVDMHHFSWMFMDILQRHAQLKWVTFHGLYDFAYLWSLLAHEDLPDSSLEFVEKLADVFGCVYDVKQMASHCCELKLGQLGLEELSKILKVERLGEAHQAGSDSLLTALVYLEMKRSRDLPEEWVEGYLYGISARIKCHHFALHSLKLEWELEELQPWRCEYDVAIDLSSFFILCGYD